MINRLGNGGSITYTAGGAIASGARVVLGATGKVSLGIASKAALASGDQIEVAIEGMFELPAVNGAAFVAGETVDYDLSADAIDDNAMTAAAGDVSDCAIAMETKTAGAGDTVKVKLLPGNGTIT